MNEPAQGAAGAGRYRIAPVADQHIAASRRMILAAAQTGGRQAIVLGAGKCQEIGLAELAARFDEIVLVDLDLAALDEGLATAGLTDSQRRKFEVRIADLTGVTDELERKWRDQIAGAADPSSAIERLASVADTEPGAAGDPGMAAISSEPFDLVVASCLLSQLHAPAAQRAEQVFAERFAVDVALLRSADRWLTSLQALARRIEAEFINWLPSLVAPGGRIYLSETVQTCLTELAADGAWTTAGTYRMTKTLDLADYVDQRFKIEQRGRWSWVAAVPQAGRSGKLFDVQALVLKVATSSKNEES